jgi:hypothetical protein
MKTLEITKYQKVETTDKRDLAIGIIAFQLVKFDVCFYGKLITDVLDTKIMRDGRQIVIDGNGFIPAGYEL